MAGSVGNDYPEVYFKLGSCNIILKKGDLMNENDVDVIVIPTPENGKQYDQNYPLFGALCSKVSSNLKKDITRIAAGMTRSNGQRIITNASPSIILTTTPYFKNETAAIRMLRGTYVGCLNCASNANCQTIAFPTIGCGESGFSTYDAAQTIYDSLAQFGQSTNKQFKEIRIIIFKEEIYKEFIPIFIDLGSKGNAKIKFTGMYVLLHNNLCSDLNFRIIFSEYSFYFRSSEKPKTGEMPPEGDRQPAPRRDPKKEDTSK
jgi:O-acetyl-ADP-ribose deacetylase (regulator of RNase III)